MEATTEIDGIEYIMVIDEDGEEHFIPADPDEFFDGEDHFAGMEPPAHWEP